MLEALVSSRIRRTLFEYLLLHPHDRFYLRGLAKTLNLSVSPLRRELKRLERSGMLRTVQEANILFYEVNTASPTFLQLQQAGLAVQPTARHTEQSVAAEVSEPADQPSAEVHETAARVPAAVSPAQPVGTGRRDVTPGARDGWNAPLRTPAMIGVAGLGVALMLIVVGVFYLSFTNQRLLSMLGQRRLAAPASARASTSGSMRGSRWQVVPGGFGGFGTSARREVY